MSENDARQPADETEDRAAFEQEFAEVIAPLGRLAERLSEEVYPGLAWPGRPEPTRGRVLRLLVPAAAAAAVLVAAATAVHLVPWTSPPKPAPQAQRPATAPAERPTGATESVVTPRIDPSVAAYVTWRMPRVSMPSTRDANGLTWSVPRFTFPALSWPSPKRPAGKVTTQPKQT